MTFEPGKTYRTRDGREARVYATDGRRKYPVHGATLDWDGWRPQQWTAAGRYFAFDEESPDDLLPPAPPAPLDEASWRAGAEAMKCAAFAAAERVSSNAGLMVLGTPLPTPPAAPAPETERLSGELWLNVYPGFWGEIHGSRKDADLFPTLSDGDRIACIRIDLSQHRKGEGL